MRVGVLAVGRGGDATVRTTTGMVVVESASVGEALDGDQVRVEMLGRRIGRVVTVVTRRPRRLVGGVYAGRWFECNDDHLRRALRIDASGIDEDTLIGVELIPSLTSCAAEVRLVHVFGTRGTERAETAAARWRDEDDRLERIL